MDKYFIWIHYERLHNHNKAKHNKTVCIFLGTYCRAIHVCCHYPWPNGNKWVAILFGDIKLYHLIRPQRLQWQYFNWSYDNPLARIAAFRNTFAYGSRFPVLWQSIFPVTFQRTSIIPVQFQRLWAMYHACAPSDDTYTRKRHNKALRILYEKQCRYISLINDHTMYAMCMWLRCLLDGFCAAHTLLDYPRYNRVSSYRVQFSQKYL